MVLAASRRAVSILGGTAFGNFLVFLVRCLVIFEVLFRQAICVCLNFSLVSNFDQFYIRFLMADSAPSEV
jgi:hypothetical protein